MSESTGQDCDTGCICKGNWRAIVKESEHLLDKRFKDDKGKEYVFIGFVHARDDYYYGMLPVGGGNIFLLSCVGNLESHLFELCEAG